MPQPLTILVVHNHYQQRGGEDSVFETECAMLRGSGHTVICYEKHNDEINSGEKRLAASGQRLEAPTAQVLGTRYQVLANTRFPKKDNPQALAPSPYHLAPSPTPTHPHTHTLPPNPVKKTWRSLRSLRENDLTPSSPSTPRSLYSHTETQRHREDQISCQSCNPVNKTFRVFSCFSWLKKHFTPSSPSSPRSLSSHTETQSHREEIVSTPPNKNLRESAESADKITYPTSVLSVVSVVEKLLSPFVRFVSFVVNKPSLFFATIWSRQSYREISEIIQREKPDIVHCHNTFPLISPSVYWAAAKQGIPVVQTLHNYRLICINPYLYRNGHICEDCLGHSPLRGVIHRCYRGSFSASVTVAAMLIAHRLLGTYRNKVTTYIALTEFGRKKFLEARLCDPAKVVVKPNAVGASAPTAQVLGTRYQVLANAATTEEGVATKRHQKPQKETSSHTEAPRHREQLSPSFTFQVSRFHSPFASIRGSTHEAQGQISNLKSQISNPPTVLYVGRLSPEKGVDILIAAWKLLLEQRLAASGQRLGGEAAEGSGVGVQEEETLSRALSQTLSNQEQELGEATSSTKPTSSTPSASPSDGSTCHTHTPTHPHTPLAPSPPPRTSHPPSP